MNLLALLISIVLTTAPVLSPAPLVAAPGSSTPYVRQSADVHNVVNDLDRAKQSYLADQRTRIEDERTQKQIDQFLAGTGPLEGYGAVFVREARRTNCSPYIGPAIAYAESSLANENLYEYQPFGMYGVHPSSYEDSIIKFYDNLNAHWGSVWDAHQLVSPNYCEPPEPYNTNVQGLVEAIGRME